MANAQPPSAIHKQMPNKKSFFSLNVAPALADDDVANAPGPALTLPPKPKELGKKAQAERVPLSIPSLPNPFGGGGGAPAPANAPVPAGPPSSSYGHAFGFKDDRFVLGALGVPLGVTAVAIPYYLVVANSALRKMKGPSLAEKYNENPVEVIGTSLVLWICFFAAAGLVISLLRSRRKAVASGKESKEPLIAACNL